MKKILALLLATIMVFGLVACSNNNSTNTPDTTPNSSTPGTETPGETDNPGETETPADGSWVIKDDVTAPTIAEPEKVTEKVNFIQADAMFNVELYKAPWADMNPDDVLADLKALPFFEGWTWHKEFEEVGYGQLYTDIDQQRAYDYTVKLVATQPVDDFVTNKVYVSFTGETNAYVGWRGISVGYYIPGEEMNAEKQDAIKPILQAVFGEYTDYMLYAPETDAQYHEMRYSVDNSIGSQAISRKLDDSDVYFSAYSYSKLKNNFEFFGGNYSPILRDAPMYSNDVFKNVGPLNFNLIDKVGYDFLRKWVEDYDYTAPGSYGKLYTYKVTQYENRDMDIKFNCDLLVYQKDKSVIEGLTFQLGYEVEVRGSNIQVTDVTVNMPALNEDWSNNDPEDPSVIKRLNENLTYAKQVANAVFKTDFDFADVYWNGSGDNKTYATFKTEMYGREVSIRFDFATKTSDALGCNRASFKISID